LVAALAVLGLVASPVFAVTLDVGEHAAKITDHSNLFFGDADGDGMLDPVPHMGPAGIIVGAEQRTVFRVTTIYDEQGGIDFDTSSSSELTGLTYDLELVGVAFLSPTDLVLDFAPMGRNPIPVASDVDGDLATMPIDLGTGLPYDIGGVIEIYEDYAKNYTANPGGVVRYDDTTKFPGGTAAPPVPQDPGNGPSFWVEGQLAAVRDSYTTVSNGTLWLSMVLLDLDYMVSIGQIDAPATPYAAGTVLRETLDLSKGEGHGSAYANIVGGSYESNITRGYAGGLADMHILFDLDTPIFDPQTGLLIDTPNYWGIGQWTIDSEDPIVFATSIIPEPATLTLLGLGLMGMGGLRMRRKRK
jgi:hypothetical protein